ncbi:hypothetical protein TVAG_402000 [Trichomonas vaginalis G3]|uniref:Uncharacterized protein n=1 Tax=Trichomonas vaginalis (strain ATCC PRA-98 / G3) TaxID=412133 RepID=A2DHV7_TRIV3|nr:hypothetical protein TVAGG3_0271500 [Trichomonas vaginalis G3]EAY19946.1 hypothetical protein TVAG_402000 [Trichomonas vaginalis G3]KAI5525896.1 hypothetical protein TVAGG3_0271500 [Trichomonas vaginalis G3]|eukprot:XP_001580932.1 hypothetical protein [Trichomonas vaginalis G3]
MITSFKYCTFKDNKGGPLIGSVKDFIFFDDCELENNEEGGTLDRMYVGKTYNFKIIHTSKPKTYEKIVCPITEDIHFADLVRAKQHRLNQ